VVQASVHALNGLSRRPQLAAIRAGGRHASFRRNGGGNLPVFSGGVALTA
jgi:hypothetical protein